MANGSFVEADLTTTLACNNDCVFCPRPDLEGILVPTSRLLAALASLRRRADGVVLTGGEVTVRRDFLALLAECRRLGFKSVGIVTNGRAFSSAGAALAALRAGLTDAAVSVYSVRAEMHDAITRVKGSSLQTWLGLARLLAARHEGRRARVRVNIVAAAQNERELEATLLRAAELGATSLLLIDPVSSGRGEDLVPHERVRRLIRALDVEPLMRGVSVGLRGYPACAFAELIEKPRPAGPMWRWEPFDLDTTPGNGPRTLAAYRRSVESRYARVPACRGCVWAGRCPGFQASYLGRFGSGGARA